MAGDKLNSDYGTGEKSLVIYTLGLIACIGLSIIPYWAVKQGTISRTGILEVVFISAVVQFLVQVICFLRLNARTDQSKMNLMSFIFTLVILFILVGGSLWIMINLNYNMMH